MVKSSYQEHIRDPVKSYISSLKGNGFLWIDKLTSLSLHDKIGYKQFAQTSQYIVRMCIIAVACLFFVKASEANAHIVDAISSICITIACAIQSYFVLKRISYKPVKMEMHSITVGSTVLLFSEIKEIELYRPYYLLFPSQHILCECKTKRGVERFKLLDPMGFIDALSFTGHRDKLLSRKK